MVAERNIAAKGRTRARLWRGTALRVDEWRSEAYQTGYLTRQVHFGILDLPTAPFEEGLMLGDLP